MNLNTEANLQAELYHACRLIGLQVAVEVTSSFGRFDVLILSDDRKRGIAIVEVKQENWQFSHGTTPQIRRYKLSGLPVYGLAAGKDPHKLALSLKEKHSKDIGIELKKLDAVGKPYQHLRRTQARRARHERLKENLNIKGGW